MKTKLLSYLSAAGCFLSLSYLVYFLFDQQTVVLLTSEDNVFETLGALLLFTVSILSFILFLKDKQGNDLLFLRTKKNVFFLLLAISFFIGFGEEISWGQRIFNFQIPEMLWKINLQKELNIHNISFFNRIDAYKNTKSFWHLLINFDRLFSIFWCTWCFIFPIANRLSYNISKRLTMLNLPILPISIGAFFMLNYLAAKLIQLLHPMDNMRNQLVEIKECNFAFLFLIGCIWFMNNYDNRKKSDHNFTHIKTHSESSISIDV